MCVWLVEAQVGDQLTRENPGVVGLRALGLVVPRFVFRMILHRQYWRHRASRQASKRGRTRHQVTGDGILPVMLCCSVWPAWPSVI